MIVCGPTGGILQAIYDLKFIYTSVQRLLTVDPPRVALTFEGGGTLRLCVFSCRGGASAVGSSRPGSFTPVETPSLIEEREDSCPGGDSEWRKIMNEWILNWLTDDAAGAEVLPGGVGTSCGSIIGSVVARLEECCCLCVSWPRTADGSGWSLISAGEREVRVERGIKPQPNIVTSGLVLSHWRLNSPCWAVTWLFSTRWAFPSEGTGLCREGGPLSLQRTAPLPDDSAAVWPLFWVRREAASCSADLELVTAATGLAAFRDPKPEPRTDD